MSRKTPLTIGEVINDGKNFWTIFRVKDVPTAYISDNEGNPIEADNYIRVFHDNIRVKRKQSFTHLETISREFNGKVYTYIKIERKDYDTMASQLDSRYRAFIENAPKQTIDKYDRLTDSNYHFDAAELVCDFFDHPQKYNPKLKVSSKLILVNHNQPE